MNPSLSAQINLYCCMYPECLGEYSTKFNLKRHVESSHMNLKKYQCDVCSSSFSSKQSIKEHLRIHSGVMPYKCTACDKMFRQASQLSLHKRIHIIEGVKSEFIIMKTDEEVFEPDEVQVSFEVNFDKLRLPEVKDERAGLSRLPLPFFD